MTNYSRDWGGNTGRHWLCDFCFGTVSASRLGAGARGGRDATVADVAAMLHVLEARLNPAVEAETEPNPTFYRPIRPSFGPPDCGNCGRPWVDHDVITNGMCPSPPRA